MWNGEERRKRMGNDFEPQTPFEGYVAAKLEGMEKRLDVLPCGETFKRLNRIENDVANIKGKATILGMITGFVGGFISKFIIGK